MDIVTDRLDEMGEVGVVKPPEHPHQPVEQDAHFGGMVEGVDNGNILVANIAFLSSSVCNTPTLWSGGVRC